METIKRAQTAAHLEQLGIGATTFAPPAYRVAWWLGLDIAPPLFTRFGFSLIAQAIFYAVCIGGVLLALDVLGVRVGSLPVILVGAMLCGAALGLIEALHYRLVARRYDLPRWNRYTPPAATQ